MCMISDECDQSGSFHGSDGGGKTEPGSKEKDTSLLSIISSELKGKGLHI